MGTWPQGGYGTHRLSGRALTMNEYLIRHIPPDLWARFKTRSVADGIPMRALVLLLIEAYVNGRIDVKAGEN